MNELYASAAAGNATHEQVDRTVTTVTLAAINSIATDTY